jgi:uncharacterized protein
MSSDQMVFVPSHEFGPAERYGVFSGFEPSTQTLPAGRQFTPAFQPLPIDIVFEKDIAVTLRDGVTIYVDVFRPVGAEKVPVIIAWSPYGKGQGTSDSAVNLFKLVGLDTGIVSGLHKQEGPDPAYWCARGYAICNADMRGTMHSEGDSVFFDRQEGRDGYDLVEWLGVQDWCNGKVGMSGTSYLAASQWFTAAEQPPHLAAINPWEGVSDTYRDLVRRGGMPDTGFAQLIQDGSFFGKGCKEDILAEAELYPTINELWEQKIPQLDRITVPAYIVASYTNTLHRMGTFRAWRQISSKDKWLRIHNSQEWPDYYDEDNREDLRRFFDHVLKGEDNGWGQTPPVRYALLDFQGGDVVNVAAQQFPPDGVSSTKYYLDSRTRGLVTEAPTEEGAVTYRAEANPGWASFIVRFDDDTTLVGYPKARLYVEAAGADDIDLFVFVEKLDEYGTPLQAFTIPNQGAIALDSTERGATILRSKGADGRLRVSMRHLDDALTTDDIPAHTFDRIEKLQPGQVVDVEIELSPVGLVFKAGQQLRLIVSAQDLFGPMMPGVRQYSPHNTGNHIIHTGGSRASYLQLQVQDPRSD